jgi:hypothetical protein
MLILLVEMSLISGHMSLHQAGQGKRIHMLQSCTPHQQIALQGMID